MSPSAKAYDELDGAAYNALLDSDFCPQQFGYYPYPYDPTQYVQCSYGMPYLFDCGSNELTFDVDISGCNWSSDTRYAIITPAWQPPFTNVDVVETCKVSPDGTRLETPGEAYFECQGGFPVVFDYYHFLSYTSNEQLLNATNLCDIEDPLMTKDPNATYAFAGLDGQILVGCHNDQIVNASDWPPTEID